MRPHSPAPLAAAPAWGVTACAKADTADAARIRGEELHSLHSLHSSHSFPRSCCLPGSAPETPGPRQRLRTSWTQIRAVFWGQTMHGGQGEVLSHTSLGFLVEICLSSSLLRWDMEKCRRFRKSQDTQCKAPTGHSGGHSVAQDVTRNLQTLSGAKYPNMCSFGPDSSPCSLRPKFHFLQLSSSSSARDRASCRPV